MKSAIKQQKRARRHARVRAKVSGTKDVPRLSVFRSNAYIYAQLIDDQTGTTLASADDKKAKSGTKVARAEKVGTDLAKAATGKKIKRVVFDRGGFRFTGRVKALADAARAGGLEF